MNGRTSIKHDELFRLFDESIGVQFKRKEIYAVYISGREVNGFELGSDSKFYTIVFENCEIRNSTFNWKGVVQFYGCDVYDSAFNCNDGAGSATLSRMNRCFFNLAFSADGVRSHLLTELPYMDRGAMPRSIVDCTFADCTVRSVNVADTALFERCQFRNARLNNFQNCSIQWSTFDGHNKIIGELSGVKFSEVRFNSGCIFEYIDVRNCSITRRTLNSLGPTRGGLTDSDMEGFKLTDPLIEVEKMFSGYYRFLHWISVVGFIAPYVGFVGWKWFQHLANPDAPNSSPMVWQLVKYIALGGQADAGMFRIAFSITLFVLYLIYNGSRTILYCKLSEIKADEAIRQAPSQESITTSFAYKLLPAVRFGAKAVFWLFIANTIMFAMTEVPSD